MFKSAGWREVIGICSGRISPTVISILGQIRGFRKHTGHLRALEPGEIYAKTVNIAADGSVLRAYSRMNALLRNEGYFDRVRASQYFERPTDRRKRVRNEARWRRYREYISMKVYSSSQYYHRKALLDKYDLNH